MSTEVFMIEIVMLSNNPVQILVVVRVFLLLSVYGFDADSAKSTVCESLSDNSFDEVCKDLGILLHPCLLERTSAQEEC